MTDQHDTPDPTELREEAEAEIEQIERDASEEEADRVAERESLGVDEPREERDNPDV